MWSYIFNHQLKVSLEIKTEFFSIKVDWRSNDMVYVLYAGDPAKGVVVDMGSKGSGKDQESSHLGELRECAGH